MGFDNVIAMAPVCRAHAEGRSLRSGAPSDDPDFARVLVPADIDSTPVTPDVFLAVKKIVAAVERG